MRSLLYALSSLSLVCSPFALALNIDLNNTQSISSAAKTIVQNIISIYDGGNGTSIPGLFPTPYYWWNAGLAFDSLINYWALTGDDTYNDLVSKGLLFQIGQDDDYMPSNQSATIGNEDQATWALATMTAAEKGFPNPPSSSGVDSWLELAENVFNTQVPRWDTSSCNGGLRWQIFPFNAGYDYKNSLSNGDFMQLAARLFRYTGNQTYSDWASKVSEWSMNIGLIDHSTSAVYDGTSTQQNCKDINKIQWTASVGTYLTANIYMYNATQADEWRANLGGLYIHFAETFFNNGSSALTEIACAPNNCNNDQQSFRAILARALANFRALASSLKIAGGLDESLNSIIDASAQGAAGQCSGGKNGTTCGSNWATTKWDGTQGLGQDLSALEAILAAIPSAGVRTDNSTGTTGNTGGTSPGGSQTSSGASPSSTNGVGRQVAPLVLLATALLFAYII